MRLNTLRVENFLSIGPAVELDLRKRGLVGVEGHNRDDPSASNNGSGKTALFVDAPCWCLWGITTRGYDGDEVVNLDAARDCLVTLTLTVRSQEVEIVRARKHRTYKHRLMLTVDGRDETKPSNKETQEAIEQLLGMNAATFLNSIMFGATQRYRFSALTDKQQKEVFDDALGIAQYAEAYTVTREELRTTEALLEAQLVKARTVKDARKAAEKRLDELKRDAATETARNRKHQRTVHKKIEKLDKRYRVVVEIARTLDECKEQLTLRQKELTRVQLEREHAKGKRHQLEREHKRLISELRTAIKRKSDYICRTCGSKVSKKTYKKHINDITKQLRVTGRDLNIVTDIVRSGKLFEREALEAVRTADRRFGRAQVANDDTQSIGFRMNGLRKTLRDKDTTHYAQLIKKCKLEISKWEKEEKSVSVEKDLLSKEIEELEFWVEAFGTKGLRSHLIDTALPYLNERVAHYAQILTDDAVTIEFKTQSKLKSGSVVDKFEVSAVNRYGADTYAGCSGGERSKIDLCVGLALQDLVTSRAPEKVSVVFFDEIFDKLDEAGVERAVNVLTEVAKERESVFVVTHLDSFKSYFPSTITVVKRKRTSRIQEE